MSTEDVPVEENFDWNDERRKKHEERQEKHAQYFSWDLFFLKLNNTLINLDFDI